MAMTDVERAKLQAYLGGAPIDPEEVEMIVAGEVDDLMERGESLVAPIIRHILGELRRKVYALRT
jgi:hypothetical protein